MFTRIGVGRQHHHNKNKSKGQDDQVIESQGLLKRTHTQQQREDDEEDENDERKEQQHYEIQSIRLDQLTPELPQSHAQQHHSYHHHHNHHHQSHPHPPLPSSHGHAHASPPISPSASSSPIYHHHSSVELSLTPTSSAMESSPAHSHESSPIPSPIVAPSPSSSNEAMIAPPAIVHPTPVSVNGQQPVFIRRRPKFPSARRNRALQPLPFIVRWGGFIGASLVMALGIIATAIYFGVLHRHPAPTPITKLPSSSSPPSSTLTTSLNATAVLEDIASSKTTLDARAAALAEHEQQRLRQQEEFRAALEQFDADLRRLAKARSQLEEKKNRIDDQTSDVERLRVHADADADSRHNSFNGFGDAFAHLKWRHTMNVHMIARMLDKLILGWPIRIGIITTHSHLHAHAIISSPAPSAGSSSSPPSSPLHHYLTDVVTWMNYNFPVANDPTVRSSIGIPTADERLTHSVWRHSLDEDASTSILEASFCWSEVFSIGDMPDLLLVDIGALNSSTSHGIDPNSPFTPIVNLERLTRSVLEMVETYRIQQMSLHSTSPSSSSSSSSSHPSSHLNHTRISSSLIGTALMLVDSTGDGNKHTPMKDAITYASNRYGLPVIKAPVAAIQKTDLKHAYSHIANRLQHQLYSLMNNYKRSERSSLESHLLSPQLVDIPSSHSSSSASSSSSSSSRHPGVSTVATVSTPSVTPFTGDFTLPAIRSSPPSSTSTVTSPSTLPKKAPIKVFRRKGSQPSPTTPITSPTDQRSLLSRSILHQSQHRYAWMDDWNVPKTYARYSLPPIRSLQPLPLGLPHHPINGVTLNFTCRHLGLAFRHAERVDRSTAPSWLRLAEYHLFVPHISADNEPSSVTSMVTDPTWLQAASKSHSSSVQPSTIGQPNLPYAKMSLQNVTRSVILFYSSKSAVAHQAKVWLSCESIPTDGVTISTHPILIDGHATDTHSTGVEVWPTPKDSLPSSNATPTSLPLQSSIVYPCSFTHLHIQLLSPVEFHILGHAES